MSGISITPYFPFFRVNIIGQRVMVASSLIQASPDQRYRPICYVCKTSSVISHKWLQRPIRDLNMGPAHVSIECRYRQIYCLNCRRFLLEDLEFFEPSQRVTKRFACYIHELCKLLTIQDVARHFDLDWKTVKNIDKAFLEKEFAQTDYNNLTILAVDEISIKRGHTYMTVVLDYLTGRVV